MAGSINEWYADRADSSDGPGDGEYVERQAAWDTRRSDRALGKPAKPTNKKQRAKKAKKAKTIQSGANVVGLNPEIAKLKPAIVAMRLRHPGVTHQFLVDRLRADGVWVSRKDVGAVLSTPKKAPAGAKNGRGARKQPIVAATPSTPPRTARAVASHRTAVVKTKSRNAVTRGVSGEEGASTIGQREVREADQSRRQEIAARRVAVRREPTKLPPMRLSLDETTRRPVKTTGWRRARGAQTVVDAPRIDSEVPIPCYACGVVPTQFGSCRCT